MELHMALRLQAYEDGAAPLFRDAWAQLGREAEARGLTDERLETPLREIDIENAAVGRHCLSRQIESEEALGRAVAVWASARNAAGVGTAW